VDGKIENGVFVAFTTGAEDKVKELSEQFPEPNLLRPVDSEISFRSLKTIQDQIGDERTLTQQGVDGANGPNGGHYDIDIDVKSSRVVVTIEKSGPNAERHFRERYGSAVTVKQGPISEPTSCLSRRRCGLALRGGVAARKNSDFNYDNCTTGFTVYQGSAIKMLSAGHCSNSVGNPRYHGLNAPIQFGSVQNRLMYGLVDVEMSNIGNSFTGYPWVYRTQEDQQYPVESFRSADSVPLGWTVCKLGITSGRTCGNVLSKSYMPDYVDHGTGFFRSTACTDDRDSGGPVISGTEAMGISSGRVGPAGCASANPGDSIFGHISFALWAMNASLLTAP